jgi:aspartate racemase
MTSVGIVGGLGVGATVHYYEKITAACKARGVVPDLVIVHAEVDYGQGLVRAGKLDELADYLASFIERLGRAGAEAAVLPAVTPHIAIAQLKQRTRLPILNIVDPIEAELKARKIGRVALYGTILHHARQSLGPAHGRRDREAAAAGNGLHRQGLPAHPRQPEGRSC